MKRLFAMLLALAIVFALVSCGMGGTNPVDANGSSAPAASDPIPDTSDPAPSAKTEITVGWLGTNYVVNPFDTVMGFGFALSGATQTYLIYDQMFYADNNGNYQSRIFDSWEWEDDTTLVCHLKDSIYFSNGDQLTGEDIIYTFELMQAGFFPIKFMYAFVDTASSYTEDDGLTLYLKTFSVTPSAIPFMYLGIMDKDYIESVGGENIDWFDPAQCVGSGPYKPVEFVQDGYSVFELRDDYWGFDYGYEQTIEKMTVQLYGDATSMMADYANGVIDLAWGVSKTDYDAALNGEYGNSGAGIVTNHFVSWLVLEADDGPTADPAVREAICYAIDTDALRQTVLGSLGVTATGALATSMLGYTGEYQYSYDPAYAQQVLSDAGYASGDITIDYAYKTTDPVQVQTAELVQAYLGAIGINVALRGLDEATYSSEETVEGYSDIAYYFMSNGADDPGQFMGNWMSTGSNAVIGRHGLYDDVINRSNSTMNENVRAEALKELQKLWYENFDLVPLFELGTGYIYNADVFTECDIQSFTGNLIDHVSVG